MHAPRVCSSLIEVEIIRDAAGLLAFRPEWSHFLRRVPPPTPFQTPEWLLTWWSHFGSGELRTMVFRRRDEVAGVLPCFRHEWNGRRQLTLVGTGVTDYLDPVFDPERAGPILDLLRSQLKQWDDWDLCEWQDLSPDSPLVVLGSAVEDMPCCGVPIEGSYDDFLARLPAPVRRNLRTSRRKAEAAGPLEFQVATAPDPELLDGLVKLHRARWEMAGQSGMIEANHSEAFLRDGAREFAACGWLRMFVVRFSGKIVAVLFAFCNQTTIFAYLSAFDPKYEDFSFGREMIAQALRYAHENGYRYWDFLRGEEPFKAQWGARTVPRRRVRITPPLS